MIKPLISDDKFAAWFAGILMGLLFAGGILFVLSPDSLTRNLFFYLGLMLATSFISILAAVAFPKQWSTNVGTEARTYIGIAVGLGLGLLFQLGTPASIIKLSYFGDLSNTYFVNIFAPIVEEFVFRGIILNAVYFLTVRILGEKNAYARAVGIATAIIVSSYAFGAWHIFAYGTNQIGPDYSKLGTIAFIGALFAIADLLVGSLLVSICFHFINNLGATNLPYTAIIPDALVFGAVLIAFSYISRRVGGSGLRVNSA